MTNNEILYGAAYYDEYMPYDRIKTDMQMMKDAGMNVIDKKTKKKKWIQVVHNCAKKVGISAV